MQQKLMGFFKYSPFPYVVAFEIEKFDEKGGAVVKQVGTFSADNILCIRPIKSGRTLKDAIEGLKRAHRKRMREVENEFISKVEDCLGVKVSS
jgi:hypothetical protein